jgi:Family of unknown function (DUF6508)
MTNTQILSIKQRLRRVGQFSQVFKQNGFRFGKMVTKDPDTGEFMMPYYSFSKEAERFIKTCYKCGWVLADLDLGTWKGTAEALELRDNPDAMAKATPDQIAKLLTVLIRLERFCSGSLANAFKSGLLVAILRRAIALAHDE